MRVNQCTESFNCNRHDVLSQMDILEKNGWWVVRVQFLNDTMSKVYAVCLGNTRKCEYHNE